MSIRSTKSWKLGILLLSFLTTCSTAQVRLLPENRIPCLLEWMNNGTLNSVDLSLVSSISMNGNMIVFRIPTDTVSINLDQARLLPEEFLRKWRTCKAKTAT